jgi:hypothetical protein
MLPPIQVCYRVELAGLRLAYAAAREQPSRALPSSIDGY